MKKLTKAEYQRKFEKRTQLEAKKKNLAEARQTKRQHRLRNGCATLVVPERRPDQEAACAFLVRKRKEK